MEVCYVDRTHQFFMADLNHAVELICVRVFWGRWVGICLVARELRCTLGSLPLPSPPKQLDAGDWAGVPTVHWCHTPLRCVCEVLQGIQSHTHTHVCYFSLADTWGVTSVFRRAVNPIVPCQHDAGGELMGMLVICPSPHSLVVNCLGSTSYAFPD